MKYLFLLFVCAPLFAVSPQGVCTESTVTCGTSNGTLLAANSLRGAWLIQNQGSDTSGTCHIKVGAVITGTEGFKVNSGQNWDSTVMFPKSAVYCKCDSASQTIEVVQCNW
jgi:hypothetical protein